MKIKLFCIPGCNRCLLISVIILLQCAIANAHADTINLVIDKSSKELAVKQGDKIIKRYPIATGKGGEGAKRLIGDKKTPVGVYRIIDFKENSKFYFFMQLDYPNLLDAWYGYKNNIISAGEFKKITYAYKNDSRPPQDTRLGGYIGIHGIGQEDEQKIQIHNGYNWTDGCIALTNDQIVDLKKYVSIGTKVIINE